MMKISTLALVFLFLVALMLGPATPAQDANGQDGAAEKLETFVPTEKLPADSAISFPVDI